MPTEIEQLLRDAAGPLPTQAGAPCPATFQPSTPRGFFRRLNPSIWIGNAF